MPSLDDLLPQPSTGLLSDDMIGPRARQVLHLGTPVIYEFFESHGERFGWFEDGEMGDVTVHWLDGSRLVGRCTWVLRVRRANGCWRVDKAGACPAVWAARMLAGMEWAGREGYAVGFRDSAPIVLGHVKLKPGSGTLVPGYWRAVRR